MLLARHLEIVRQLKVKPEFGGAAEVPGQPRMAVSGVTPRLPCAISGKRVGGHAERNQ